MKSWLVCLAGEKERALQAGPRTRVSFPAGQKFEITDVQLVTGHEYDQSEFVCEETARSLAAKDPEHWQIVTEAEIEELERMLSL